MTFNFGLAAVVYGFQIYNLKFFLAGLINTDGEILCTSVMHHKLQLPCCDHNVV